MDTNESAKKIINSKEKREIPNEMCVKVGQLYKESLHKERIAKVYKKLHLKLTLFFFLRFKA